MCSSDLQAEAGDEAAQPFTRADPLAEIDDEIELARARAQALDLVAESRADGRLGVAAAVEGERSRAAARCHADIADLIQGRPAPRATDPPAALPRSAGGDGCEEKRLKSNYGF